MKKLFLILIFGLLTLTFIVNNNNVYAYIQLDSAILNKSEPYYNGQPESNINRYLFVMFYDDDTLFSADLRSIVGYAWSINSLNDLIYIIDLQSTMTLFNGTSPIFTLNPHMIIFNTGDTLFNSYVQFIDKNGLVLEQVSYDNIYLSSYEWLIEYEVQLIDLQEYYRGYDNGFTLGYEQGYNLGRDSAFNEGLEEGKILGFNYGRESYGFWDGSSWLTATEFGLSAFQQGYNDGLAEQNPFGIYSVIGYGLNTLYYVLDTEIWPGFKLGYLFYIPLGFSLLLFFLKWKKGS